MGLSEESDVDITELLDRTSALAETLCKWGPCLHTQELQDDFAELGQRLADLVAIGMDPGGLGVVTGAILATFQKMQQLADKMVREMKD